MTIHILLFYGVVRSMWCVSSICSCTCFTHSPLSNVTMYVVYLLWPRCRLARSSFVLSEFPAVSGVDLYVASHAYPRSGSPPMCPFWSGFNDVFSRFTKPWAAMKAWSWPDLISCWIIRTSVVVPSERVSSSVVACLQSRLVQCL